MNFPFKQKRSGNMLIREFSKDSNPDELIWHRDRSDRVVKVVEGSGWLLQMDNQVPALMEVGKQYHIPKNTYHRVIKGSTNLVLEINEGSHLREYIRKLLVDDVRKRGDEWCAYVDDKLTKAEKENNPKKYKGKQVGSVQKTKSGKIRMKARACYRSKKKANNAMAAAMMG